MRIGIYGGAFNPVHKGHVKLAEEVKTKADLDRIIIMPSGVSPHKSSDTIIGSEHRLKMCELACEGEDYIISDLEIKREGKSYTADTLAAQTGSAPPSRSTARSTLKNRIQICFFICELFSKANGKRILHPPRPQRR